MSSFMSFTSEHKPRAESCQIRILHSLYCHFTQTKNARPWRIRLTAVWKKILFHLSFIDLRSSDCYINHFACLSLLNLHPKSLACDNLASIALALNT